MTGSPGLQIQLFGILNVEYGDTPLLLPASAAVRSLLAYLCLHNNRPIPRDRLTGIFWPERPDAAARRALSQALWRIRRALGPASGRLETEQDTVAFCLSPQDRLDVEVFRQFCSRRLSASPAEELGQLQEAVALYRGDLLEAIYDDWALLERERLRETYLAALERLITLHKQRQDYDQALAYARQLVDADPLREAAHRDLMRLYHLTGRPQAALAQYTRLRDSLACEMGIEPTPTTTALAREIAERADLTSPHLPLTNTAPPAPLLEGGALSPLPLVGRREERTTLLAHLDAAIAGHGGLVFVEGEAGVGKTRLLQEIAQDAAWRGVLVFWGRSTETTLAQSYYPLAEALRAALSPLRAEQLNALVPEVWLSQVSSLIPQLAEWLPHLAPPAPLDPDQEQVRFLEALVRVLRGLAWIAPHLLILEDLHWADEATLAALAYIAPQLEHDRLLILASHRRGEVRGDASRWETFRALDRMAGGRRLLLDRLDQQETAELIQRSLALSAQAPLFSRRIHRESEGNPLFVLEILRALYSQGLLYRDGAGGWHIPQDETASGQAEMPLPSTVKQVIRQRLAPLDDETRALLNAAATLDQGATFRLLLAMTEMSQGRLLAALDELRRRHLLLESPDGYRFSHGKVRQVVYAGMDEATRRHLHRRVALALESQAPHQVAALAFHFERGALWAQALRCHRQAAEQAASVHAYAVAARHYEQALALANWVGLPSQERFDLLTAYGIALSTLGRREEQLDHLDAMARLAGDDPRRLAEVYRRRARVLLQISRYQDAREAAQQAIRLARQAGDLLIEARSLVLLGTFWGIQGQRERALRYAQQAVAAGRRLGDGLVEAEAHSLLASVFLVANEHGSARRHAEAGLRLYERLDYKRGIAGLLNTLTRIEALEGNLTQAEAYHRQALAICRAIGFRREEARSLVNWGLSLSAQGRIGEALRLYRQALDAYRSAGERRGEALALGNLADLHHTFLGDDEEARRRAQAALQYYEAIRYPDRGYATLVLGRIALRRGEYEQAQALLEESLATMRSLGKRQGEVDTLRALADLALARGQPTTALECLEQAEAIGQQAGLTPLLAHLLALRGLALLALGRRKAALAASEQALERLEPGTEQGYLIPFARYRVLSALGRPQEARQAIEQAYQMLEAVLQDLSPEQQAMSRERVPEHRAIVRDWQAMQPRRLPFRLPRAEAPTGRPLRDDEWLEVIWTVAAPEDEAIQGKVARRRQRLLRLLREAAAQGAAPTVVHLADALQASERTIKRDLAALRAAGHETPTRRYTQRQSRD